METKVSILKIDGTEAAQLDINPQWVELEKGAQAVHETVVSFLARMRAGSACTKTRSEVRGGGAKPWRQKGTGRARAGSNRSPIWRGGGITFGPKPRSYGKHVNKKIRLLALKRAFSERLNDGDVIVVEAFDVAEPRTKAVNVVLNALNTGNDVLIVCDDVTTNVALATRNLPGVEAMRASVVNPYWLLLFKKILFTQAGLEAFTRRFTSEEPQA